MTNEATTSQYLHVLHVSSDIKTVTSLLVCGHNGQHNGGEFNPLPTIHVALMLSISGEVPQIQSKLSRLYMYSTV